MTRTKTIQAMTAAAVLIFGSFAGSAALAHKGGHGHGHGHHKKKHKHRHHYDDDDRRYYDDDDRRYYDDDDRRYYDDDDYRRRKRRHRYNDDDDHRRYDDDGYGHRLTEVGVDELQFFDLGGRLGAQLVLDGVGEQTPIALTLEATAEVETQCQQPGTITRAVPERVDLSTEGVQTVERAAGEPAQIAAEVQTSDASPLARDLSGCASALAVGQVQFLDARVDVQHGSETLTLLCTFLTPTTDGPIAAGQFECVVL